MLPDTYITKLYNFQTSPKTLASTFYSRFHNKLNGHNRLINDTITTDMPIKNATEKELNERYPFLI